MKTNHKHQKLNSVRQLCNSVFRIKCHTKNWLDQIIFVRSQKLAKQGSNEDTKETILHSLLPWNPGMQQKSHRSLTIDR